MSVACRAKLYMLDLLREYLLAIVGFTVLAGAAFAQFRRCMYGRRVSGLSNELYSALKSDLAGMGRSVQGVSERDMLNKYLALPQGRGDRVARDEGTFTREILPNLE